MDKNGVSRPSVLISIDVRTNMVGKYAIPFGLIMEIAGKMVLQTGTIVISVDEGEEWTFRMNEINRTTTQNNQISNWEINKTIKPTKTSHKRKTTEHTVDKAAVQYLETEEGCGIEETEELKELSNMMRTGPTRENYVKYFKTLLWLEEEAENKRSGSLIVSKVPAKVLDRSGLLLEMRRKKACLIVGNKISFKCPNGKEAFEGYVSRVCRGQVEVRNIDKRFFEAFRQSNSKWVDVQLHIARLPIQRQHRALDMMAQRGFLNHLFPDQANFQKPANTTPRTEWFEEEGDFVALESIMDLPPKAPPYLMLGSTPSGKTLTLITSVINIVTGTEDKNVLLCAPNNFQCDQLIAMLEDEFLGPTTVLRACSTSRNPNQLPRRLYPYTNLSDSKRYFKRLTAKDLNKYRLVVSTLMFIGKFDEEIYRPDYIFVHESNQATEPELCVAISRLADNGNLVLAGTENQLKPIVKSECAKKYGLGVPMIQRLMETQKIYKENQPLCAIKMRRNIFSHSALPRLAEIFDRSQFTPGFDLSRILDEKDPLTTMNIFVHTGIVNAEHRLMGPDFPMEICSMVSEEKQRGLSTSFYNSDEAKMVLKYIETLLKLDISKKVTQDQIGVISFYSMQVSTVKNLLLEKGFDRVEVGTVESFQGARKRVVIVTTVRAKCGVLKYTDDNTFNVWKDYARIKSAILSASSKVVLIGCFTHLWEDKKWSCLLAECSNRKAYFGYPQITWDVTQQIFDKSKIYSDLLAIPPTNPTGEKEQLTDNDKLDEFLVEGVEETLYFESSSSEDEGSEDESSDEPSSSESSVSEKKESATSQGTTNIGKLEGSQVKRVNQTIFFDSSSSEAASEDECEGEAASESSDSEKKEDAATDTSSPSVSSFEVVSRGSSDQETSSNSSFEMVT